MDEIRPPDRVVSNFFANSIPHPNSNNKIILIIGLTTIRKPRAPPNPGKAIPNIRGHALTSTGLGSAFNTP